MKRSPRDFNAAARTGVVRAARVFSNVVSPPIMFACLGFALAIREVGVWPGVGWAVAYGLLVSLAPILFVLWLLQTGRIRELHMSNTGERHLPYTVATLCAALALGLIYFLDGPRLLLCLAIFNVAELASLAVINVFWLISIHTTGMMATTLITGLVFGPGVAWALVPLLLLVIWARLFLRRHTSWQIAAGMILGAAWTWGLAATGCF